MIENALDYLLGLDYSSLSNLAKENCKKVSLVTSCMDRNQYLYVALKSWLNFPFKEIIIVDWSSKIPITFKKMPENVKLVRVDNQEKYHFSKVRNFKISLSSEETVLSIDSDIVLKPKFASDFILRDNYFYLSKVVDESIIGTSIVNKTLYNEIGGCNELLDGWGYEDLDLYYRLVKNKYNISNINRNNLYHIEHNDIKRVENTNYENKWISNSNNMYLAEKYNNFKNSIFKEKYTITYSNGKKESYND